MLTSSRPGLVGPRGHGREDRRAVLSRAGVGTVAKSAGDQSGGTVRDGIGERVDGLVEGSILAGRESQEIQVEGDDVIKAVRACREVIKGKMEGVSLFHVRIEELEAENGELQSKNKSLVAI